MDPKSGTAEEAIRELATAAHGVVTRSELLRAGLTADEIRGRLKRGALVRVHSGVYRAGHSAPSREATYIAAVKACGNRAVLCGRAAAHLWGLLKGSPPQPEVLASTNRRVRGVIVHRARRTGGVKVVMRLGVPVTTVPRTLVALASSLPEPALARACHEAGVLYRTTPSQVEAVLTQLPSAPGRRKLERILRGDVRITLSRLEARFLELLKRAGLRLPRTNRLVDGRRVDCRWPERRVTVELDGYRYHHSRHAWEQDRQREREAHARGDEFRRYTYRDVFESPALMLADLAGLLR